MLGTDAAPEPKPAASGPREARGLTALLDGLDEAPPTPQPLPPPVDVAPLPEPREPRPQGKKRSQSSTQGETRPLRSGTARGPAPAPPGWSSDTADASGVPVLSETPVPKRPKTDSSTYPRVDNTSNDDAVTFEQPLDPDIPRPVSPVFEPAFTPPPVTVEEPLPEPLPELESEPVQLANQLEPEPEPAVADDPEAAAAAVDAAVIKSDPLAELRAVEARRKPRTLMWVGIISFVAAGLGAVIYTQADAFHPERDKTRAMVAADEKDRAIAEHRRKQPVEGTLLIDASEAEAAVWLKLGRTPLESLMVSSSMVHEVRFELEGYKTQDAVVARPQWAGEGGEQRAELEIQLAPGSDAPPAYPPQSAVRPAPGPKGKGAMQLGSRPSGAEVWLLIGFTPEVKFTGVQVGRSYEIKVLKDGYRPSFAAITPDDWMRGDREVDVDVKLSAVVADKRRRR